MSRTKDALIAAINERQTMVALAERKGDWMQLHSGTHFYPLDPRPEDIVITDIAHALSMICRFGGHVREFYSVAQHSCIVASLLPEHLQLAGLLHDATEAYLVDIPRPLKMALSQYKAIEHGLEAVIAEVFGVDFRDPLIKRADNIALMTEARDLLSSVPEGWNINERPETFTIMPASPSFSERCFLQAFHALTAPRKAA